MNKEFIPHEQSIALKRLGFDDECVGYYSPDMDGKYYLFTSSTDNTNRMEKYNPNVCPAPLYQQAFRWFREKYDLYSTTEVDQTMEPKFCYSLSKYKGDFQWDNILPTYSELYYTYEEAELACLKKLIEIVKNK